jgi:uncharacterized protein (DUF2236 family)
LRLRAWELSGIVAWKASRSLEQSMPTTSSVEELRRSLARAISVRISGPNGDTVHRRIEAAQSGWFGADRPIRRVHGDAAMFVGGLRALLLQSLHPLAMAAVAEHSGYQSDPWGRLQRTAAFLALTTYGSAEDAERAVASVRAVHAGIQGVAPDGRVYRADDPVLLEWVHLAETDSFLRCYQRYGAQRLTPDAADAYVADAALVAGKLGVIDPPRSRAELERRIESYRAQLGGTAEARTAARFLLLQPPLPFPARAPYAVLAAAAIAELPRWARWPLRLPYLPLSEATLVRASGHALVETTRWIMSASRPASSATIPTPAGHERTAADPASPK